jgi:hypothetical protein
LISERDASLGIADHCFGVYRAGAFMRVGTIHAGAADLVSPTSIQPDNRVMTIGASSERLVEGRVLIPIVRCVVAVVEFVMAFPFLVESCELV